MVQSPQIPTTWHRQELLTYIFFAALLLLIALSAKVAYQYTLPQPQWVTIGNIADFREGEPVLVDLGSMNVWVVQRAERIDVFNPFSHSSFMPGGVLWDREREVFVEPYLGIRYARNGLYVEGPAAKPMLDRYAVHMAEDGTISIETTKPILGMTWEEFFDACVAYANVPAWYVTWGGWWQFCADDKFPLPK